MSSPYTILYIEDDPISRRLISRMLELAGYCVFTADTGLAGIDIARNEQPDFILTDINLPDINGNELTTLLRNETRFKETPIVALTAQGKVGREIAMAAGLTGYLTKPLNVDRLLLQIQYYLSGGRDQVDPAKLEHAQADYARAMVGKLEQRIRQLEDANESLRRLDKTKETFIQITAHELRTPLTLVYGYTRLLKDNEAFVKLAHADESLGTVFDGLDEAVNRMQIMIEDILIMSRIIVDRIEPSLAPTNLGRIVQEVLQDFNGALHHRQISVAFDINQWPRKMQADASLLRLAISNLVSNAIKYTPDGGSISLEAEVSESHVEFNVNDTGVGISLENQMHIFDQFFTINDVSLHSTSKTAFMGGGLGLGLPVSRGIFEAHGGFIRVNSPKHDPETLPGCSFKVQLPLIAVPRARSPFENEQSDG